MKKIIAIISTVLFISVNSFGQMMHDMYQQDTAKQGNMMYHQRMMNQYGMDNNMMNQYGMRPGMMMDGSYMGNQMMMGGMMNHMYNMMGNNSQQMPMQKYQMLVNDLPSMQQQLNLTSDQANQLIDMRSDYLKKKIDWQASLQKERMKLNELLESNASANAVQQQIEACTSIKTTMKVEAYKTGMAMKKILNSDQLEKLKKSAPYCQNNNMMHYNMSH